MESAWSLPQEKEGRCSGIPAGYSLTHSLDLCCMPRQRNCVTMPLLTSRQGSCPKKTNGSQNNADIPWRNGGGRPQAQGSNPTREEPEARLPIGEPRPGNESNGRVHVRGERSLPNHRRAKVTRFPVVCTQEKDLRLRKRHGRNMHGSMREGRKDARGASTDLDHGKKATRTKRSGPLLHPVSAL